MLNEGLAKMAVGMGTIFTFLVILWLVVMMLGKIVAYLNKIFPTEVEAVAKTVKTVSDDVNVALAIAVAKLKR